jgi:hypothetical protein
MLKKKIGLLLNAARDEIHHDEYVIIGSLSVLGAHDTPPQGMVTSVDVDLYPKNDPDRAGEVAKNLALAAHLKLHTASTRTPYRQHLPLYRTVGNYAWYV